MLQEIKGHKKILKSKQLIVAMVHGLVLGQCDLVLQASDSKEIESHVGRLLVAMVYDWVHGQLD